MIAPGRHESLTRRFAASDVDAYVALGGARPPAGTVPEPLLLALFSNLLGTQLPGVGTNYLKQDTTFVTDAELGEALTATVEVTRVRPDKHLVDLATTCRRGAGEIICHGRALVYVRDVAEPIAETA